MQVVTIEILNNKALRLLQDLELLQLIRMHKEKNQPANEMNRVHKYKGAMSKQPLKDIDSQLKELRNG